MTATPGCFFLGLLVLVLVNSARWFDTVAWMLLSVAVSTSCIVMLRLISGRITSLNISYRISLACTVVTRHTLVWKRILVAVFSLCPVISRRRWHRSVWNFARWYISVPDRSSPLLGRYPGIPKSEILGLNFGHLTAISKAVSYMSIRA